MAAQRVHRVTLFKIPNEDDKAKIIEQYNILKANAKKDGKPYIYSLVVGFPEQDALTQGFTVVSKSEFTSQEDHDYYESECAAHKALKLYAKDNIQLDGPPLTTKFTPAFVLEL